MKLYTEEQMHTVMLLVLGRHQIYIPTKHYQDLIDLLTPIELPSDEEIDTASLMISKDRKEFLMGAKYVINKIQGGNK